MTFFSRLLAAIFLLPLLPVWALTALGIRTASRGPILFRSPRVGKDGRVFTIFKLRTMHVVEEGGGAITLSNDERVFAFGEVLRATKLDETPQLLNILMGDMAFVGPRPESVGIVETAYSKGLRDSLNVLPGLASPGSIFNFTHASALLEEVRNERDYVRSVLPLKLALDYRLFGGTSFPYRLRIVARALGVILARLFGRRRFRLPPEWWEVTDVLDMWRRDGTISEGEWADIEKVKCKIEATHQ